MTTVTGARVRDFALPDLGEGLTEGEILQWLVAEGDTVGLNQPIVEVETAKAAVEVPSPYAGVVVRLHHAAGTVVDVGAVIISVDTDPGAGALPARPVQAPAAAGGAAPGVHDAASRAAAAGHPEAGDLVPPPPAQGFVEPGLVGGGAVGALIGEVGPTGRTATLVGYGPKPGAAHRRPRTDGPAAGSAPAPAPARISAAAVGESAAVAVGRPAGGVSVLAKPPVRKLARELDVDLAVLHGSGPGGTITRADVQAAASLAAVATPAVAPGGPAAGPGSAEAAPSFDPATRERRIPVRGVRKLTAAAMVGSAFTAPHVTEFVTLDMTASMDLVARLRTLPEFAGVKVSPLLLVAKALLLAVKRNPDINATWDEAAQEIVVKQYVNLGIAAATPRGLVVPNVKDADAMDLVTLGRALQSLAETARQGRTPPADMQRGTITITNVGVFGVDSGTPILNPGESAILCFGAVRPMPWVVDGELAVRQVTQLSLSFDHRNVDGQLGSRFLSDVARVLSDPATALLWA